MVKDWPRWLATELNKTHKSRLSRLVMHPLKKPLRCRNLTMLTTFVLQNAKYAGCGKLLLLVWCLPTLLLQAAETAKAVTLLAAKDPSFAAFLGILFSRKNRIEPLRVSLPRCPLCEPIRCLSSMATKHTSPWSRQMMACAHSSIAAATHVAKVVVWPLLL